MYTVQVVPKRLQLTAFNVAKRDCVVINPGGNDVLRCVDAILTEREKERKSEITRKKMRNVITTTELNCQLLSYCVSAMECVSQR